MTQQKNHAIVEELRNGLSQKLADCNVAIVNGEASLIDKNLILCGNVPYETRNVIIASGSRPIRLREHMLTSDEVLKLDKIPASMSIIGGEVSRRSLQKFLTDLERVFLSISVAKGY